MNHFFHRNIVIGMTCAVALAATACSSTHTHKETTTGAEQETESAQVNSVTGAVAAKEEAHSFSEIAFSRGSAKLTTSAQRQLTDLIAVAEKSGRTIDEAMVMAWGDEEMPSNRMGKLSKSQQNLADKRTEAIQAYLKGRKSGLDVESYNMARQPNLFQKWFNTDDARLKNTFIAAGLPTTADGVKVPSKAAHAVVLIKLND